MRYSARPARSFDLNAFATNLIFLYEWSVYQRQRFHSGELSDKISFPNLRTIAKTGRSFSEELGRDKLRRASDDIDDWLDRHSDKTSTIPAHEVTKLFELLARQLENWKRGDVEGLYTVARPFDDDDLSSIREALPSSRADLDEAFECLRFGRFTASVFHISRSLEAALSSVIRKLKMKQPPGATWQTLTDILNSAYKGMPGGTENQKRKRRNLAEVLAYANAARIAWRNEVMHPGQAFSKLQAEEICAASVVALKQISAFVQLGRRSNG